MLITHKLTKNFLEEKLCQGEANGNVDFLLANKRGDYASFFAENASPAVVASGDTTGHSRYQGWFLRNNNNLFKVVEKIELAEKGETLELKNEFWRFVKKNKTKEGIIEESFFLPSWQRALVYELNVPANCNIFLDFKPIYDNSELGRFYNIQIKKNKAIIECQNQNEVVFLAIIVDQPKIALKQQWVKKIYQLDQQRNSPPFERYVFWALNIFAKKIALAVANNERQAVKEANFVFNKTWKLKKEKRQEMKKAVDFVGIENKNPVTKFVDQRTLLRGQMAFCCCQNALSNLIFEEDNQTHIGAGLPWFFQVWQRDELIASKALFQKQEDVFWKIIRQYLNKTIQTEQDSDSTGWLFKRIGDFLLQRKINEIVLWKIQKYLEKMLQNYPQTNSQSELAVCSGKDTWMDTINRAGERIEIQALRLYMLKLAYLLTKNPSFRILESSLKFKVKEKFWNNEVLLDSPNDFLIRPNVFLAAYIYPELLEKNEWQRCFDNILPALWLSWGGIATCDKNSAGFVDEHTGENPKSYHSGDSWFYLNNLTAIVLNKTNPERYKDYVDKILQASTQEILFMGAIGCHSELSSANELKSQGCWNQAWSNALFIELIYESFTKKYA